MACLLVRETKANKTKKKRVIRRIRRARQKRRRKKLKEVMPQHWSFYTKHKVATIIAK